MQLSKLDTSVHNHGKENFDNAELTTKIPASTRSAAGDVSIKGNKTIVIHRRRLSKRSSTNKKNGQNRTTAIQSAGSNKTAASISKSVIGQQGTDHVKLVTAVRGRQEPVRKVSYNERNKRGTVDARNHTTSKRVSSYRNNQVKEMRDDREEKNNHYRSPVGVKLRLQSMLLEPKISDLTSIPSLRVLSTDMNEERDDYEAEEFPAKELVQEPNGFLSHFIHKTPTTISLEETIARRGKTPLEEPPNRRCGYRSSYMKESAVQQGGEKRTGNAIENKDGQEEIVYSNTKNNSYQDNEVCDRQRIRDARTFNRHNGIVSSYTNDDNNQTYHLKEVTSASYMRVLPQQTIDQIPVQKKNLSGRVEAPVSPHTATYHPKGQRGVISIPPGIATHLGLSKLPEHLYTSEVGPVKIAESCSIQGHSNEQPMKNLKSARSRFLLAPSFESAMRKDMKLKAEGDMNNKHGTGTHKAHDSENLMGNEDAFVPAKDLYLTKISKKGNLRRIVSRHIGLKRERSSMKKKHVEMNSEGKNKQLRRNSLFGFRRNQLNSAVSSLSLGYKTPVHNNIELASTAPMKTKGKVIVPDLLTYAESTRYSEMFTPSDTGADVNDFLSFGLCGLGYLTCMLTDEDLRKKRSDSPHIFPSYRNHLEVIGSNMSNSLTFDESHSSRTESHTGFFKGSSLEGNGRDSNFPPKSSEEVPLLKYPTPRSSIEKETETRLLSKEVKTPLETFHGRSVTLGPTISSGAAPFCFSTSSKSLALISGCCIPVDVNDIEGKRGFSVQKRTRKLNQCAPVTREMMFECNDFFTERKELKSDHIVPVDSGITSTTAVKGSLLRIRASKLCNLTKPGGLLKRSMQAKPRYMSSKKSQEGNWRFMKSLLDDDGSSCHQFSESSSNLRTTSPEKKHNSRGLKIKKKGKIKKLWAVKLFR